MSTTVEKKHAKFGASNSKRWLNCAAAVPLAEKAPPARSNEYADAGTAAHALLEEALTAYQSPSARKAYKKAITMLPGGVRHSYEWIVGRFSEAKGAQLLIEEKVDLSFIHPEMFGTIDAAIVDEFGTLTVFDYKNGVSLVEVKENTQLIYYALALAHKYSYNFQKVELVIGQPNAYHEDGTIRSWVITIDELLTWKDVFDQAVTKSLAASNLSDLSNYKTGEWCKYCPAMVICPKVSDEKFEEASIAFSDSGAVALPSVKSLDPESVSRSLKAFKHVEDYIAEVRAYAMNQLETGKTIPGFKLVEKRATRKWNDAEKAAKDAKKLFGTKAFAPTELLSPAQFEKALKDEKAKKWLSKNATAVSSGLTLAEDTDTREAKQSLVDQMFPDLPAEVKIEEPKKNNSLEHLITRGAKRASKIKTKKQKTSKTKYKH